MLADVIVAAAIANWRRVNMVISQVASSTTHCARSRHVSAPIARRDLYVSSGCLENFGSVKAAGSRIELGIECHNVIAHLFH
jgi:hypothetical protein